MIKFVLYCDNDPRVLGIEDEYGNWNMAKFKSHIRGCPDCQHFLVLLGIGIFDILDELARLAKDE